MRTHINRRLLTRVIVVSIVSLLPTFPLSADSALSKPKAPVELDDPYMVREFDISGPGFLEVFTVVGNIEVIPSSSAGNVRVELYVDRGFAFWSNSRNLDNFRITMLQRGNEIIASVERRGRENFFSDRMNFTFRVFVPESMSTELRTLGGNVTLQNVRGRHDVRTGGGNITLRNISGRMEVYTSGGNIDINDSRGMISAQTEGGNITLDQNSGEIRVRTNGGRIISERISGSMLAHVGGGDIHADFVEVAEGVSLETRTGNIVLELPDQAGYEFMLNGSEINFPQIQLVRGEVSQGNVRGIYKEGGPPINLSTNAGSVTLRIID